MSFGLGRTSLAMRAALAGFASGLAIGSPLKGLQVAESAIRQSKDRYAYQGIRPGKGTAAHKRAARKSRNVKRFRAQSRS